MINWHFFFFSDLGLSVTPVPGLSVPGLPLVPVGVAPAIPLTPVVTSVTPVPSSTPLPAVPAVPQFDIRQPGDDFIEQSRFNPNPTPAPFVPLNQTPGPFEGTPFGQRIPFRPKPLDHLEPAGPPVTSPSPFSAFPAFPATPAPEAPRNNLASIFSTLQDNQPAQPAPNVGPIDPLARQPFSSQNNPFGFNAFANNAIGSSDTALFPDTPLTPVVDSRFPLNGVPGGAGIPVPAVPRPGAVTAVPGQFESIFGQKAGSPTPTPGAFVFNNPKGSEKLQETEEIKEPNSINDSSQQLISDTAPTVFTPTPKPQNPKTPYI